jgi:tetratricopeptide (TPR) repeat protein
MHGPTSNTHLILMLVIIVLDVISLVERYGNIVGDYSPQWVLPLVPFIPLLAVLFWAKKANFARDSGGHLTYRPIWRHLTKVLLALTIVAAILVATPRKVVSSELPVLIADLDDYTQDRIFSRTSARTLLTFALEQSPRMAIFSQQQIEDVMRRMEKSPKGQITVDVGREICDREGVGPLITWSASEIAGGYTLEARILDPKSASLLGEVKVGPFARNEIVESIGELGRKLLKSFGDSSLQIYVSSKPLAPATTGSLPALQVYTEAIQKLAEFDYKEAEARLLKALELDSNFALAMVELASLYEYKGDTQSAIAFLRRAFERSDSLTEPERVRVHEYYYWLVENNHAKALDEVNDFLTRYPRNQERLGTLADDAFTLMKFDIAEEANQKLIGRPPWRKSSAENGVAVWRTQLARNELKRALETSLQMRRDIPDFTVNSYLVPISNLALGDIAATENEISDLRGSENTEAMFWLSGLLHLYRGKLKSTKQEWTQYVPFINQPERSVTAWTTNEGNAHLWVARVALLEGDREKARWQLDQIREVRDEFLAESGKYYARLGDLKKASEIIKGLRARLADRSTNQNQLLLALLESEIELGKGNLQQSFALMSQTPDYPWAYLYWPAHESQAHISIATGHPDAAIKACNEMIVQKGFAFSWDRPDDWVMAHYYLGRAYDSLGKKDLALSAYIQFENLWHNGDPELLPLKHARKRIFELKLLAGHFRHPWVFSKGSISPQLSFAPSSYRNSGSR